MQEDYIRQVESQPFPVTAVSTPWRDAQSDEVGYRF